MLRQALLGVSRNNTVRSAVGKAPVSRDVVRRFVAAGIHHIFIGPDHILFVIGLLLLGGSLRRLLKIVTGFTIPGTDPPTAETDGPLGALFLARALAPLGISVAIAADGTAMPALAAGLKACGLSGAVPLSTAGSQRGMLGAETLPCDCAAFS